MTEIHGFDPAIALEEASTPPSAWYSSAEFHALERELVFGPSWQFAARTTQLERPGDYVAGRTAGAPWVEKLVYELMVFPAGKYDDQVDVMSLFGRMLNLLAKGLKPEEDVPAKFQERETAPERFAPRHAVAQMPAGLE